ncbi:MAG: lysylphosphatidylglycerol synthase domain-containing protein [Pyrinomonadaceae bacterium]
MQSEDYLEPDTDNNDETTKRLSGKGVWLWLHAITFLVGLSLLTWLIYNYWEQVRQSVLNVGWGFLIVVGLNITRHLLRALTMYRAVDPAHRTFKYRSAVAARFGGEAVNFFTFTGPFLGDATKAILLKKNVSITQSASAVIIDNVLYYITVILVVLAGVAILLAQYDSTGSTMSRVLFGIVIVAIVMLAGLVLAMMYRFKPLTYLIKQLNKRGVAPSFILKKKDTFESVESNVFHFYHDRRADFFSVFGISMITHCVSVTEVFLLLKLLGNVPFVSTAFIIESLTKVINASFSFIPGTIGAYEGGNGIILRTLGYTTATGIALALVRRGAILFSTFIGCIILLWRTAEGGAKRLKENKNKTLER